MMPQTEARLEDVRWMAETGECLDGAARRLGLSVNTLERFLWRNDAACLRLLLSRQPRDHNRVAVDDVNVYDLTGHGRTSRDRQRRRLRGSAA